MIHASRVFTGAKTEVVVVAAAVVAADRSDTAAEGEEEPAALEEVHIRLIVGLGDTEDSSADPYSAAVGRSVVDLFVLGVKADELLYPFPLESYP